MIFYILSPGEMKMKGLLVCLSSFQWKDYLPRKFEVLAERR